jgi:hypothetical protein
MEAAPYDWRLVWAANVGPGGGCVCVGGGWFVSPMLRRGGCEGGWYVSLMLRKGGAVSGGLLARSERLDEA